MCVVLLWEAVSPVTKSPHPLSQGWYRSFMQHVRCHLLLFSLPPAPGARSASPIQNPKSKIQNVLPLVHLLLTTYTTEIRQFRTRKLPVLGQKIASSGTESCQFRTRKLPVFHSFARLLRTCMTTGRKKVHLTRSRLAGPAGRVPEGQAKPGSRVKVQNGAPSWLFILHFAF